MKKILIFLFIAALTLSFSGIVNAAGAATLGFSESSMSVNEGESFNVEITVYPNGESLDTARAFIGFPADLLEVQNFTLGEIFPNVAPGNITDNGNGYISQGGYLKGAQTGNGGVFGTITFKAIAAGTANLGFVSGSRLISIGEEKINLAGSGSTLVTINPVDNVEEFVPEKAQVEIPSKEAEETEPEDGEVVEQEVTISYLQVTSLTHSNQNTWYNDGNVIADLTVTGEPLYKVVNYLYSFDAEPVADPSEELEEGIKQIEISGLEDGVWYFHGRAKFEDDSMSDSVHFRVMVDMTAPSALSPITDKAEINKGETTYLRFSTVDQTSGIGHYEVTIDGKTVTERSPYLLTNLSAGETKIVVTAFDMAGNSVTGETSINVIAKPFFQRIGTWVGIILVVVAVAIFAKFNKKPKRRKKW